MFCNTNISATATAAITREKKNEATSSESGKEFSFTSATGRSSNNAGVIIKVNGVISKMGLRIFALVICAIGNRALM